MGRPAVVGARALEIDLKAQDAPRRRHAARRGRPDRDRRHDRAASRSTTSRSSTPEWTSTSSACSSGPTSSAGSACARTPTRPRTPRKAREFGAEGIGLCRTEHMFMAADRQPKMRAMIMADDEDERRAALDELLPLQQRGLRGPVRGDGRAAGHDPAARPAAARVPPEPAGPARARSSARGSRTPTTSTSSSSMLDARRGDPRGEPDARHARLPAGDPPPRDLRDAGRGDHARRRRACERGAAAPRDHDPARRLRARARDHARARRPRRPTSRG